MSAEHTRQQEPSRPSPIMLEYAFNNLPKRPEDAPQYGYARCISFQSQSNEYLYRLQSSITQLLNEACETQEVGDSFILGGLVAHQALNMEFDIPRIDAEEIDTASRFAGVVSALETIMTRDLEQYLGTVLNQSVAVLEEHEDLLDVVKGYEHGLGLEEGTYLRGGVGFMLGIVMPAIHRQEVDAISNYFSTEVSKLDDPKAFQRWLGNG